MHEIEFIAWGDAEAVETPEAGHRFQAVMTKILSVPRAVFVERLKEHRRSVESNPNRRGPNWNNKLQAQLELLAKLQEERQALDDTIAKVQATLAEKKLTR
jgi:hypothetical protein